MKKLILTLLFVFVTGLVLLSSCHVGCINGSGTASTENRKPGNFIKVEAEGAFKITLKQDSSFGVTVTADDNLQKYIHTTVSGNRLRIYSRKNLCNKTTTNIIIGVGNLEFLRGAGAVELANEGKLNVRDLKIDLSGSCKANLDLNAANLITEGTGSTEVHLKGQASSHKIDLTGSGKLYAFDFITGDYDVETTGASEVEINVLHRLKINTTGAASIKYKGSPSVIQNEKAGASSVTKVE